MAEATSYTDANLSVGDSFQNKVVARVFDATAGRYAWVNKPPVDKQVEDNWEANTNYDVGTEFIQPRSSDGLPWLYQVPSSFTAPSGATWDATEEARYTAIGMPPGPEVVATVGDLPDPNSKTVGDTVVVSNDGVNSGTYTAVGSAPGQPATTFVLA